ncbi:MAG: hypothetical protein WC807_01155 [Hyphomicrobium sp.]
MRKATLAAALVFIATNQGPSAVAEEYCVNCAGPAAIYRCTIQGTADGRGADPRHQLLCIGELAKTGKHETCTVSKSAPFPCPGELKVVAAPPNTLPTGPAPQVAAPAPPTSSPVPASPTDVPAADAAAPAPQEGPAKVPQTVEELAGQTVKSTKEGLEKAGEAVGGSAKKAGEQIGSAGNVVGDAAKKTWNCLTSLLKDC